MARKKKICLSLALICALVGAFFFAQFWGENAEIQREYAEAQTEYADLREIAGVPDTTNTSEDTDHLQTEGIDFDALFAINPDVVGWIAVPNTNISYPIVQGADNRHYLHHTFNGTRNASGAVFLDFRDNPNFQSVARVFAHNMRNGSMFAPLLHWQGEAFTIHTPEGVFIFDVTFRGAVATSHEVFTADHAEDEIILVTCINGRPNQRYIIRASLRDILSRSDHNN